MDRFSKLCQKASHSASSLSFKELCWLVEKRGYEFKRQTGSHRIYMHTSRRDIINLQKSHGKAKPYQVRQVLGIIDELGLLNEGGSR